MIYGHPCAGPSGPARALACNRKSEERKENIWIQALKTKAIRTALKILKKQEKVHVNRQSIREVHFLQKLAKTTPLGRGDLAFSRAHVDFQGASVRWPQI